MSHDISSREVLVTHLKDRDELHRSTDGERRVILTTPRSELSRWTLDELRATHTGLHAWQLVPGRGGPRGRVDEDGREYRRDDDPASDGGGVAS